MRAASIRSTASIVRRRRRVLAVSATGGLALVALAVGSGPQLRSAATAVRDPTAHARIDLRTVRNFEATVPPQCYTATAGVSNPCWTCHVAPHHPNDLADWELQEEYAFSDFAMTNRWSNLFVDRSEAVAEIPEAEILEWIRTDNYGPFRDAMAGVEDYPGYRPDLNFDAGFDAEGFANDGSGWRAIRYKPFLGTFWPTNGATDDVLIRLPDAFGTLNGIASREILKVNYAILDAAIAAGPMAGRRDADLVHRVEPVDEGVAGRDLDGDGTIGGIVEVIRGLPERFCGDASEVAIERYKYPTGTEFLHTVRYIDPDAPSLRSRRLKELRYSRKVDYLDAWAMAYRYEREYNEKEDGELPVFTGSPLVGIRNGYGWQLQGFIEDAEGDLRLQTAEEHQFCMGCHSAVGVSVDHTFTLPRKLPGAAGWGYDYLDGIPDVPQQGHARGEILTYLELVGGGDEFRANREMIERFFDAEGRVREDMVSRAGVGGDRDIRWLLEPSWERAMLLNRIYRTIVAEQSYEFGRDAVVGPIENVHEFIENGSTDLADTGRVFTDGVLWLDWSGVDAGG